MKRLTLEFPDDAHLDVSSLITVATRIELVTIDNAITIPRRKKAKPPGKRADATIMSHYTPAGAFTSEIAAGWMEKEGFAPTSTSKILTTLTASGHLSKAAPGHYTFVKPLGAIPAVRAAT